MRARVDGADPHAEDLSRAHAEDCRLLAGLLLRLGRRAEAAQALQEATDAFRGLPDGAAEAGCCTREVLAVIRSMWEHPHERLYLLIARHDRELRRLAMAPDTELERARIAFRVGTILQRRDRFVEAAVRYRSALELYRRVEGAGLSVAECHLRIGGLCHHELKIQGEARRHYLAAAALYAECAPQSEDARMNHALCLDLLRGLDPGEP